MNIVQCSCYYNTYYCVIYSQITYRLCFRFIFAEVVKLIFLVNFFSKMINSKIKTMEKTGHFILFVITDKLKVSFIPSFFENALEVLSFPEIMEKLCLENKDSWKLWTSVQPILLQRSCCVPNENIKEKENEKRKTGRK